MSQKSTKLSKSQKLLKNLKSELQAEIEARERVESNYYAKCNDLEKAEAKIKVYERSEDLLVRHGNQLYQAEIERLTEIIRWHIEPKTAEIRKPEDFPHPHFEGLTP